MTIRPAKLATAASLFWLAGIVPVIAQANPEQALEQQGNIATEFGRAYDIVLGGNSAASGMVANVSQVARLIGGVLFIFYLIRLGLEIGRNKDAKVLIVPFFLTTLFVTVMLGTPGTTPPIMTLTREALITKDGILREFLDTPILDIKLNIAINDQVENIHQKTLLRTAIQQCQANSAPPVEIPSRVRPQNPVEPLTQQQEAYYAKLECYERVQASLDETLGRNDSLCQGRQCRFTRENLRFAQAQLGESLELAYQLAVNNTILPAGGGQNPIADLPVANVPVADLPGVERLGLEGRPLEAFATDQLGSSLLNWLTVASTWIHQVFQFAIQLGFFAGILSSPLPLLYTLVPVIGSGSPMAIWARGMVTMGLTEFFYLLVIALASAFQAFLGQAGSFNDAVIIIIFNIFAPVFAGGLAVWSSSFPVTALSSGAAQLASAVPAVGGAFLNAQRSRR